MYLVKSTYGISAVLNPKVSNLALIDTVSGSSIDRKIYPKKIKNKIEDLLLRPMDEKLIVAKETKLRTMSHRTKSKIRKKIISFARIHKNLSFLTLTFVNKVEDKQAVKLLHKFLDNCVKRTKDFQYIWVAEKQTENETFKDNIHFHIITNKYWDIAKWWKYWIDLQAKFNILPRDENFKASSAFDVRHIISKNIKGVVNYLTLYVTKNVSQFDCQVWNCSKKISHLYTDFYTGLEFVNQFEKLEAAGQLGGEIKRYKNEWCNLNIIPLNRTTTKFYNRLDIKNKEIWNNQ